MNTETRHAQLSCRTLCRATSTIAAACLLALFVAPPTGIGATPSARARSTDAKSVSLRLADVLHVLGRGLTAGHAGYYPKPSAMGACTSTPPVTDYTADFYGPPRTKGVLNVVSDVYTYKSAEGPVCNQQSDISMYKILRGALGKMTTVHGVGGQAFLLDTTGPKSQGPPVYTLALKFTRGSYRAIVIVQSNRPIKVADMIALGTIVDGRMKKTA